MATPEPSIASAALRLNRRAAEPLHEQIYRMLLDQISTGVLTPGAQLPPEKQYAHSLQVSLAPVRQAILALTKDGYLSRQQGRGTFVRERKVTDQIQLLSSFTATMVATGLPFRMQVLHADTRPADPAVAQALRLNRTVKLVQIQRLAVLDDEPVALLTAYLPARRFGALLTADLSGSLYDLLSTRFDTVMAAAHNTIEVVRALPESAAALGISTGDPLLRVQGVTRDQHDQAVEYSRVLYLADRFSFHVSSDRRNGQLIHLVGNAAHGATAAPPARPRPLDQKGSPV